MGETDRIEHGSGRYITWKSIFIYVLPVVISAFMAAIGVTWVLHIQTQGNLEREVAKLTTEVRDVRSEVRDVRSMLLDEMLRDARRRLPVYHGE